MEKKQILVLSSEGHIPNENEFPGDLVFKKWTPGLFKLIPPNSPFSYILFWLAHYMKIFRNKSYCAYYIEIDNKSASSVVCIPSLFIWPFMNKNDIQTKNSFTPPKYRGQGFGYALRRHTLKEFYNEGRTLWCLIHSDNLPSLAVNKKAGMVVKGYYKVKKKVLFFINIGSVVSINE
jgi:RimJ/RimL family protein N-acetyltransferase